MSEDWDEEAAEVAAVAAPVEVSGWVLGRLDS